MQGCKKNTVQTENLISVLEPEFLRVIPQELDGIMTILLSTLLVRLLQSLAVNAVDSMVLEELSMVRKLPTALITSTESLLRLHTDPLKMVRHLERTSKCSVDQALSEFLLVETVNSGLLPKVEKLLEELELQMTMRLVQLGRVFLQAERTTGSTDLPVRLTSPISGTMLTDTLTKPRCLRNSAAKCRRLLLRIKALSGALTSEEMFGTRS